MIPDGDFENRREKPEFSRVGVEIKKSKISMGVRFFSKKKNNSKPRPKAEVTRKTIQVVEEVKVVASNATQSAHLGTFVGQS